MSLPNTDRPMGSRSLAILPARTFAGLLFTSLVLLSLIVVQHQRKIDTSLESATLLKLRTLAEEARKAVTPTGPTDFERESLLTHWQLIHRWDPMIKAASKRFGVPEDWIRAVMRQESGGRTMMAEGVKIVSPVGAQGLMQLMPGTYDEMRAEHKLGADPFNPQDNINAGAAYLRWLKSRYGFNGMFAAYNAGPGTWEQSRAGTLALPAETQNYVRSISAMLGVPDSGVKIARGFRRGHSSERIVSAEARARYRRILQTIPLPPQAINLQPGLQLATTGATTITQ